MEEEGRKEGEVGEKRGKREMYRRVDKRGEKGRGRESMIHSLCSSAI